MENLIVTFQREDVSQLLDACKILKADWEQRASQTHSQFGKREAREDQRTAEHYADIITKLETAIPSTAAIEVPMKPKAYSALESVYIIASGYEFECPACENNNTLICIPKHGTAVECHHCHTRFSIDDVTHAQS